jgi:peptidyl-tRNA hydrolase, PTH2 family
MLRQQSIITIIPASTSSCILTMVMPTTASRDNWLYFIAGALLPTLAFVLLRPRSPSATVGNDDDDDDDDEEEEDSEDEDLANISNSGQSSKWGYKDAPYKLVLCVNNELGMGKGKIAAQCGHAAVGCYKVASKQCPSGVHAWERTGCAKIAVKTPAAEMEELALRALERDIPAYLVEDAGRTQIAAGSRTVLGLGPAPVYAFEGLTSHLKLM